MPRIKILVADDVTSVREALRAVLEMDKSLEVVAEAADGDDAFRKALAVKPDVVLMDVSMPKVDGFEATKKIRAALPEAGVVLVTFQDVQESQIDECGADAYIQKGSSPDDLFAAIRCARLGVLLDTRFAHLAKHWKKTLAWLAIRNKLTLEQVDEIADGYSGGDRLDVDTLVRNYISEEELASAIADVNELTRVVLTPYSKIDASMSSSGRVKSTAGKVDLVQPKAAKMVSAALAANLRIVPIDVVGGEIVVAMADPMDHRARAMVEETVGMRVRPVVSTMSEIENAIQRVFYRLATSSIIACLLSKDQDTGQYGW